MSSGDHTGGVSGTRQRILVTGANGQVGWELLRALRGLGEVVPAARGPEILTAAGRSLALDLTDPEGLRQLVRSVQPTLIVNAAAHTAVDKAETEPELATSINAIAPGVLAEEAKRIGAAMIHFSTDYVFDGSGTTARTESDPTGPLGVYGRSKLAGELAIEASDVPHAILRTSWVYGVHGHNFVKTMLRLGSEREQLSVVADQIGAPTSARAIAEATAALVASCQGHVQETLAAKGGVFHFCCGGETSWYEFAVSIFEAARKVGHPLKVRSVRAIASHEYPTPAQRPRNSRLDCGRAARTFGVQLPHWQAAFDDTFPALFQQWHASTRSVGAPHILTFPAGKRVVTPGPQGQGS
jgi:dTDP-4-dehydrorhamnose reductase